MTSDRVIVALDHDSVDEARRCVDAIDGGCRRFKVGSILFARGGPDLVRELGGRGLRLFLDLKLHDTPNTVLGAARAARDLGVDMLTIHATGGEAMIEAARSGLGESGSRPRLLAVTVLTSLSEEDHARIFGEGADVKDVATNLGRLAIGAGADGCVCSAHEVSALRRALGPKPLLVVPGIRPAWSTADHSGQARIATPAEAIAAGATHIVVGRAVTDAADPAGAVARLASELAA